ncbi:hypothetical protein Ple7327_2557 [Pleurocapsa sp. PCC 7327]|uniref:Ig-like domain-containing protein n=1 Tax=Pleurocapsa sp. PCC 7327 TaxID=118163 RepID=UPI00029FD2A4|nr:cadherin-like domain-containing protein [Pleurocapsa sp. PCC 7327]AFY77843.1 hypothetical protein Ple7327_2557 [Pleurocapsa sp. PCC 7327]
MAETKLDSLTRRRIPSRTLEADLSESGIVPLAGEVSDDELLRDSPSNETSKIETANAQTASGEQNEANAQTTDGSSGNTPTPPSDGTSTPPSDGAPTANDDQSTTLPDTPVTIPATDLLRNDSDPNGDSLKIAEVTNPTNGGVALDNEGNVVFTPTAGFTGDASFQYTVDDGSGGRDAATVTVSVAPAQSGSLQIGTNLSGIAYYSTQQPFINAFKSAKAWVTQNDRTFDTGESELLDLDENGWVRSLPAPEAAPQYDSVGTILFRNQGEYLYPGGQYIVLYDGEGTLEYGFDAKKNQAASTPGRDVIDVTPSQSGIFLRITATDPNNNGNYIRNIRVIPANAENTYQTEPFNPAFLEKTQPFAALRFMDWMDTNNSEQKAWSDRPTPDDAKYDVKGVPVETMVDLANRIDSDPWFTMPHMASDEYIANFAQYVENNLEPGRKVYVELSNEVWNPDFAQHQYALEQAKQEFPNSGENDFNLRLDWYGKRSTEVFGIWERVFADNPDRVVGVIGAQSANIATAERVLEYAWASNPQTNKEYGVDAIAIAPYIGYELGTRKNASEVESWTKDPDGGLNKLFDEITQGGVLSNGYKGGSLKQAYDRIAAYSALTRREGLELLGAESGQSLVGIQGVENNAAITNLFAKANQDPRIGEIYRQYYDKWNELGGGLIAHFSDISLPNKFNTFGALEHVNQPGSPKYDALVSLINAASAPT